MHETVADSSIAGPLWLFILQIVQLILLVWFALVVIVGSWKLFRWLLKWKP